MLWWMDEGEVGWEGKVDPGLNGMAHAHVYTRPINQLCSISRPFPPSIEPLMLTSILETDPLQAAMDTYREGMRLFPDDKALVDGMKAAEEVNGLEDWMVLGRLLCVH